MRIRNHNIAIIFLVLIGLLVMVSVFGCASSGTQVRAEQAQAFVPNVTTRADVVKALGQPQNTMVNSDGSTRLMYIYSHMKMKASSFVPYVGLFTGGAKTNANIVTFNFDPQGKLIDHTSMDNNQDIRTGIVSGAH